MQKLHAFLLVLIILSASASAQPDTLWTSIIGDSLHQQGYSVQQTLDGGFIVAGTYGSAMGDVYLIRLDSGGAWVEDFSLSRPLEYGLYPVYPNPFNSQTRLIFTIPQSGKISLIVYDIGGREVARLADGWYSAGRHKAIFGTTGLPSGVYFTRLTAGDRQQTQRLILIR